MDFNFNGLITKDYLLSHFSEETYMEYYLGMKVSKGLKVSPLRKDNKPTCSFYRNSKGELIFKDFGNGFHGNFISVVMCKYNCTYHHALIIIANDFGIDNFSGIAKNEGYINKSPSRFKDEGPAKIQVQIRDFTSKDLEWWTQFGISKETLKKYNVYSCEAVFLNNQVQTLSKEQLVFGYYGGINNNGEMWRIYYPERREYRFLTNWPSTKIQGWEQLPKNGNIICITKSMKDSMVLHEFGIPACAPNSENLFIPKEKLEELKSRFSNIVILYDTDIAGLSNMRKFRKLYPELYYIWIPRKYHAKDISDFRKAYGKEATKDLIIQFLKWVKKSR